jgi:hypothetical protein
MISEVKEGINKHMNEFKANSSAQGNEIRTQSRI